MKNGTINFGEERTEIARKNVVNKSIKNMSSDQRKTDIMLR